MLTDRDMQPPYLPHTTTVGGVPKNMPDVPTCSVFLLFWIISAIWNQVTFQRNMRRGHKFYMSVATFGFSMAGSLTFTLRIIWANRLNNASIAIAAGVLANAGVVALYAINLLLALRVLRATHPSVGWKVWLRKGLLGVYVLLGVAFSCVIAFTVVSFYTFDMSILKAAVWVERTAAIIILVFTVIPVMFLITVACKTTTKLDNVGTGTIRSKSVIVIIAAFLGVLMEGFRFAMLWVRARPVSQPAWYQSRAAFYGIEFLPEV